MARLVQILTAAAAGAALAAVAAAQGVDGGLAAAVAGTQAATAEYAFDYQLDSSKQTWRARFDPAATPKLRLLSPAPESLDNDQRRGFARLAEEFDGVSWCASERMGRVSGVRLLREDADTATYTFQPTAESIEGLGGRFARHLRGEMTMIKARPDITRIRIYAPENFSPVPLTRIDALDVSIQCQPAPNGRRYAAETVIAMRGEALGQDFNERSTQRTTNLEAR